MTTPATDERQGVPSASGIYRLALCPGSFRMEQGMPDVGSPDADFGTLVHSYVEQEQWPDDAPPSAVDIAQSCIAIKDRLVQDWQDRLGIRLGRIVKEHRLWIHDEFSGAPLVSGKADWMGVSECGLHLLIIDDKALPGEHEDPQVNRQLRSLAVIADHQPRDSEHPQPIEAPRGGFLSITVALVQPLVSHHPTVVVYGPSELEQAKEELMRDLAAAAAQDAPLRPHPEACKYCKARSTCPALQAEAGTLVTVEETAVRVWHDMKPSAKLDLWDLACKAEIAAKAIKEACKADLEADPEAIPGLAQKEGRRTRKVTNLQGVWENVGDILSVSDFVGCCDVSLPKLEKAIKDAEGITAKQAADELLARCGQFIEEGKTAPSIKRVRLLEGVVS